MNTGGTGATFRERINWVLLGTTTLIYGGVILGTLQQPTNAFLLASLLGVGTAIYVGTLIALSIVLALRCPEEPDDERDRAIERRSTRFSQYLLGGGVMVAIGGIIAQQCARQAVSHQAGHAESFWLNPLLVGHLLLTCFVVSEIVRFATRALDYRRGFVHP